MEFKNSRFLLLLISIFCIIRIFNLEADPSVFKDTVDIHDEAWWAANAKNKVMNGSWMADEYAGGIAVAPLNSLITWSLFKLFGINFFALRLIPAMASIGIILFLFLLLNKYDKKLAVISSLLLAVNHSFFMYSRIGHVEMLMLFFTMAMFYCLALHKTFMYFTGGICFALLVLTKFSAFAFIPVVGIYFLFQWYRKAVRTKEMILFAIGSFIPFIIYYVFAYLPYRNLYALQNGITNLIIKDSWSLSLHSILLRLVFLPMSEYFIEPSVVLLIIFTGIFLVKTNMSFKIKSLPEPLLLSALWLFIGIFILLFIDFSDRRFTSLIIPLTILSGYFINQKQGEQKPGYFLPSSIIISFLLFLSLLGLHLNFHLKEFLYPYLKSKTVEGMNDELINYLFIIYAVVFLIFAFILWRKYNSRGRIYSSILFLSLLAFLTILLINSIIHLKTIFILPENKVILCLIIVAFAVFLYFLIFKNKGYIRKLFLFIYFAFNLFAIGKDLFFPTYTIAESVKYINDTLKVNKGEPIIGQPVIFELVHPTNFKILNNSVYDLHLPEIIRSQAKYRPSYYATTSNRKQPYYYFEEKKFVEENLNAGTELIKTFGWYPVNGIPRDSVFLYRIVYLK